MVEKLADNYIAQLTKGFDSICHSPKIAKGIGEIKDTHRALKVKSHLIIYEISDDAILIDRILHERMDIDSQMA